MLKETENPNGKELMASRVILLVGCSGSGKSTYVRRHFAEALVISADQYFENKARSTGQTYGEVWSLQDLGAAHSQCQQCFLEAIEGEVPIVVVDNTNVRPSDRQRYVRLARAFGVETELHVLGPWIYGTPAPTQEEYGAYIDLCHRRNVHEVPREVIGQQIDRLDLPAGVYQAEKPPRFLRLLTPF